MFFLLVVLFDFVKRERTFVVLLGIITSVLYYFSTLHSIGIDGDSVTYLKMAEWIAGYFKGQRIAYTPYFYHFPPLYPLLLSLYTIFHVNIIPFARILHGILLVLNVFLFYRIAGREYKGSGSVPFYASLLFVLLLLKIHSLALTEELFFTFELLFFYMVYEEAGKVKIPVGVFPLVMFASLTRYPGVIFILPVFFYAISEYRFRAVKVLVYAFLALLPLALYIFLGMHSTLHIAHRSPGFYYRGFCSFFFLFPAQLIYSLLPIKTLVIRGYYILAFVLAIPLSILAVDVIYLPFYRYLKVRGFKKTVKDPPLLFAGLYYLFILFSRLFFDAFVPPSLRIFSPLVIPLLLLWVRMVREFPYSRVKLWVYMILVFADAAGMLMIKGIRGWGYSGEKWYKSPTLMFVRDSIPSRVPVFTNVPDVFYLYAPSRRVYLLPFKYNPWNLSPVGSYRDSVLSIVRLVKQGSASVVYFKGFWKHSVNDGDIEEIGGIKPYREFHDGVIFFNNKSP